MSLKHAENEMGKPKKAIRESKAFGRHFLEVGNILDWFNQAI